MSQFHASPEVIGRDVNTMREDFDFSNNESGDDRSCASSTTEEQGSQPGEYIPGTFEGPEKTMEVIFRPFRGGNASDTNGLRALSRAQLDHLCHKAKCSIMSVTSNQHMDAYVLSESSLFIYSYRLIMKTCGTTTLLRCLSTLLRYADELGLELCWVGYSRKNFLYPTAQMWPHANFGDEMRYINTHEKLQHRLNGEGYILGPVTGDHWFVFVADNVHSSFNVDMLTSLNDGFAANHGCSPIPRPLHDHHAAGYGMNHSGHYRTINLMMFDMAPQTASIFFAGVNNLSGKEMTKKACIQALCPGATIDEQAFQPCGYSMNAILHDAYTTIHVTPEAECSYVSFETNTRLSTYCPLVRQVLAVFQPKRFVMTLFGDQPFMNSLRVMPTDKKYISLPAVGGYRRTSVSNTKIEKRGGQGCVMACYSFEGKKQELNSPTNIAATAMPETISAGNFGEQGQLVGVGLEPPVIPSEAERRERAYSLG